MTLKPYQHKVFGVKLGLREIENIFSTIIHNFKLLKMPKLLNFRFLEKLEKSSKIFLSFSERHRSVVEG